MDDLERFMVKPNDKVDLDKIDASERGSFESKDQAREETEAEVEKMRKLQFLMYAEGKHSLLICLQGRDAAARTGLSTTCSGR